MPRRALRQLTVDSGPAPDPSLVDTLVATEAEAQRGFLVISGDLRDFEALAQASGQLEIIDLTEVG